LGYILWAQYFMHEQEYDINALLLYQDNMSAILLKTNGQATSSTQTKHIKVKYYFIKDKVGQGEITIKHCPTNQMWADINTKTKQGLVFRVFREHIMGIPADYRDLDYKGKVPLLPKVSMLPLTKEQLALQESVRGDAIELEWVPIKPTHASRNACVFRRSDALGNACVSRCSNVSEKACIFRCSICTPTADGPKKEVRFAVNMVVCALPGEPQQAPIKTVNGRPWSPGVYQSLCILGKTLEVAWVRAFI
jgi:hypothetical protein